MKLFLCALFSLGVISPATQAGYPAELIRVIDGDTVRLSIEVWPDLFVETSIRVDGIDTPEKGGRAKCESERRAAEVTTQYTVDFMALSEQIVVSEVKHGKFAGRMLGRISVDGVDLGQVLVAAGLAREYQGGARATWCEK